MADMITLKWIPPLQERIDGLRQLGQPEDYSSIRTMANELMDIYGQALTNYAPFKSGRFASTIRGSETRGNGTIRLRFTGEGPLAGWLIRGTGPHLIQGNDKLAFYWEKIGSHVVFNHVNHPGAKATDFVRKALDASRSDVRGAASHIGSNLITELRGQRG